MKRTSSPLPVIARYVVIEAWRGGLPWLALACLLATLGFALFLARVAVVEGAALQASATAALLRACAVFVLAAHVVASVAREADDKGLELALALPIARASFYAGKLLGFGCVAVLVAAAFALPLLAWGRPADVAAWGFSLAAETALVAVAALFFATVLTQFVTAITATAGMYLLARAISAIQAIASGPLAEPSFLRTIASWSIDAIAILLPRLDLVTQTEWVLYGAPTIESLATALAGLVLYVVLLGAAGMFDFHRKNL